MELKIKKLDRNGYLAPTCCKKEYINVGKTVFPFCQKKNKKLKNRCITPFSSLYPESNLCKDSMLGNFSEVGLGIKFSGGSNSFLPSSPTETIEALLLPMDELP